MMTTTERSIPSPVSQLWDVWLSSAKTMNWTQDQMEVLTGSWMEQAKTMRHDGQKVLEVLVSQAKVNCDEAQRLSEQAMKSAMQHVPGWDMMTVGDLRRQVEDLSARVDAMEKK